MSGAEQRNQARAYLRKAREYLASAEDNLTMERATPAAGDAVHAGTSAKDAIVLALTGATGKGKDHALAAKELRQALGRRDTAATAERGLRELLSVKAEVEYGAALITLPRAQPLVRRARALVDLATDVVELGR